MEVVLLGTGDTTGTPTVGCECGTCERARRRGLQRTRFSVYVRNEATDEALLVDWSPDFRAQFLREDLPLPDVSVVTHVHFDHLDGLGNAHRLFDDLSVFAADERDPHTGESVAETVRRRYSYLDAVAVEPRSPFEAFAAAGFEVTLVPVDHPPLLSYGLRIEAPATGAALALTGDTSYGLPAASRECLRDADLLLVEGIVHAEFCEGHPAGCGHRDEDGVPRTFGTKHMTLAGARDLARELDPASSRVVHVSHFVPPERAFADDLAIDGERFVL